MTEVYSIGATPTKGTASSTKDTGAVISALKNTDYYKKLQANPIAMKQFDKMLASRTTKELFLNNSASRELYRDAGGLNLFG